MKLCSLISGGIFAVVIAMAGTVAPAAAAYDQIVAFGDSLSDQGNSYQEYGYPPVPPYYKGRYSDGPSFIDQLSGQLGLTVTASIDGGQNYAMGGAVTGQNNKNPTMSYKPPSVLQQVSTYLASVHGKADPNALYTVVIGANDVFAILQETENNPLDILGLPGVVNNGANNLRLTVAELEAAGAKHILVNNLPNMGLLPIVTEAPPGFLGLNTLLGPTIATAAAQYWDLIEAVTLLPYTKNGEVTLWDWYNTTTIVLAQGASFGVTNTTTGCVPGYGETLGVVDSCTPAQEATHAFFDQVHFTVLGYFGMTEGALCALGLPNTLSSPQSDCVVSVASVEAGRSARRLTAAELRAFSQRRILR